jgi:Tol biopolymer transport system component
MTPGVRACLLFGTLLGPLSCSSSEPNNNPAPQPELVYVELDQTTNLRSIQGYRTDQGVFEIAPGSGNLPRPAFEYLKVRPTTGELLYYSENSPSPGYVLLNASSGEYRRLDLPGDVQEWSPDGDLLTTFVAGLLTVVTVEGAERATIPCPSATTCGAPHWASSDAIVLFRRPAGGQADLWLVPFDGSGEVNLTQTPDADEIGPSYSPDGQHLAYERGDELVVSTGDGGDPRPLVDSIGLGNFPWSPDSRTVAVESTIGDQFGLTLAPLDGDPHIITPPGELLVVVSHIEWSPDGERLAYEAFDDTPGHEPGVFVIHRDGSGRNQLNRPGSPASAVAWIL